jgi:hypothetical protein
LRNLSNDWKWPLAPVDRRWRNDRSRGVAAVPACRAGLDGHRPFGRRAGVAVTGHNRPFAGRVQFRAGRRSMAAPSLVGGGII